MFCAVWYRSIFCKPINEAFICADTGSKYLTKIPKYDSERPFLVQMSNTTHNLWTLFNSANIRFFISAHNARISIESQRRLGSTNRGSRIWIRCLNLGLSTSRCGSDWDAKRDASAIFRSLYRLLWVSYGFVDVKAYWGILDCKDELDDVVLGVGEGEDVGFFCAILFSTSLDAAWCFDLRCFAKLLGFLSFVVNWQCLEN